MLEFAIHALALEGVDALRLARIEHGAGEGSGGFGEIAFMICHRNVRLRCVVSHSALERGATGEHVGGCFAVPSARAIDGGEGGTVVEHLCNVGDLAHVPRGEIEHFQTHAVDKHGKCLFYVGGVDIFKSFDGFEILTVVEPTSDAGGEIVFEGGVKLRLFDPSVGFFQSASPRGIAITASLIRFGFVDGEYRALMIVDVCVIIERQGGFVDALYHVGFFFLCLCAQGSGEERAEEHNEGCTKCAKSRVESRKVVPLLPPFPGSCQMGLRAVVMGSVGDAEGVILFSATKLRVIWDKQK